MRYMVVVEQDTSSLGHNVPDLEKGDIFPPTSQEIQT